MKAWILEDIDKLKLKKDVEKPILQENDVLVAVRAAGICGSDVQRVNVTGAHKMPLILGHEFAGQVVEIGTKVSDYWIDKRVGIFPLIPCRECSACKARKYEMCSHYSYLGSRQNGGFAEYTVVPEWNLIPLPDYVSYEQAAMLEPMAVAVHAMRRINISEKSTVFVCGLGTIGQLLVMFLLHRGIKNVYVIGSKDAQRVSVISIGVSEKNYCDSKTDDVREFVDRMTNGRGPDIFFECVGKNETVALALDLAAANGQVCLVGNPYTDILLDKNIYWKILRRQLVITGTWNSSFLGEWEADAAEDDWHYVLRCMEEKRLRPESLITHKFEFEDLYKGFEILTRKKDDYTKIMMVNVEK